MACVLDTLFFSRRFSAPFFFPFCPVPPKQPLWAYRGPVDFFLHWNLTQELALLKSERGRTWAVGWSWGLLGHCNSLGMRWWNRTVSSQMEKQGWLGCLRHEGGKIDKTGQRIRCGEEGAGGGRTRTQCTQTCTRARYSLHQCWLGTCSGLGTMPDVRLQRWARRLLCWKCSLWRGLTGGAGTTKARWEEMSDGYR